MSHKEIIENLFLANQYSTSIFDGEYVLSIGCNSLKYFEHNLKLSLKDNEESDITIILDEAINFINEAINKNKKILVHCKGGINRSPAIVVAYLVKYKLYSLLDAVDLVKNKKKSARFQPHYLNKIIKYEVINKSPI